MKKLLSMCFAAALAVGSGATDYTDQLLITLSGSEPFESTATISITESDGLYTIVLQEFSFSGMLIGDVTMTDIEAEEGSDGAVYFETSQTASITNGDLIATLLGGVVDVTIRPGSCLRDGKPYLVISLPISIPEASMEFDVRAVFGTGGYQVSNGSFENFHEASVSMGTSTSTSDEPNGWHSFMSASGTSSTLIYLAAATPVTYVSSEVRPNSNGASSVLIKSFSIMGIVANGTITTGRMYVGSMTASDESNHAYLDLSETDTDPNGDPFYAELRSEPDSLVVWVKFKQQTVQEDYPYASLNAVITDGTYYQDPEGSNEYNNVVAKASAKIESADFAWQRLSLPFDYESYEANGVEPAAVLITLSTNAEPGKGSTDTLYVDDLELIYNCGLTALSIAGTEVELVDGVTEYDVEVAGTMTEEDIVVETDGRQANVITSLEESETGYTLSLSVIGGDWQNWGDYTINITNTVAGIATVRTGTTDEECYDLQGRRCSEPTKGIYIRGGKKIIK